jgi:hypothetical protein
MAAISDFDLAGSDDGFDSIAGGRGLLDLWPSRRSRAQNLDGALMREAAKASVTVFVRDSLWMLVGGS